MFLKLVVFLSSGMCLTMPVHDDVNGIRFQIFVKIWMVEDSKTGCF